MPVASKLLKESLNVCFWRIQKWINPRRWTLYSGPPWNPWLIGLFTGSTLCFDLHLWNGPYSLYRLACTLSIIRSGSDDSHANTRQAGCWLAAHPYRLQRAESIPGLAAASHCFAQAGESAALFQACRVGNSNISQPTLEVALQECCGRAARLHCIDTRQMGFDCLLQKSKCET